MHVTTHAERRMNQRSINRLMTHLALSHGRQHGDHYVLDRNTIADLMEERNAEAERLRIERLALERASKQGGLTVVSTGGNIITAFGNHSQKRVRRQNNQG